MAINFLNTVDLNNNQLNNAAIQNLATDPIVGVLGQLIFNTTANLLKVCTTASSTGPTVNAVYSEIGSGVTGVTTTDGTYINLTPIALTTGEVTVTADISAVDGTAVAATRFLSKDNTWDIPAFPAQSDTTYDLTSAPTGTAIRLSGSDSTNDDVTFSGTTGQTAVTRIGASELRVALTDDVTIVDDLSVGGVIEQTGAGENLFSGNLNLQTAGLKNVATGVSSTDGVNLGQVELLVAGVGVFKGAYDATSDPGSPKLSGASNIALDQGDYFVVSVAGTLLGQTLEPGDFIFVDAAIAASSTPTAADYTFIIADANIAGADSSDGATKKGVAGFDSENFTVSSNGWVQLKPQSNPYATSVDLTSGVDAGGETTFTVDITALFGTGALAANCRAEVVTATGRQTVYPDITGNGVGSLDFKFVPVVADSVYEALITIV